MHLRESVDAFYAVALAQGITPTEPLTDQFWGDRTFTVTHPDGYVIQFGETVRDVSLEQVQDHLAQATPTTV